MTRIAHFSDLHGNLGPLFNSTEIPDVWVCSGDVAPNFARGDASTEVPFQAQWFLGQIADIVARLGGRPVVCVGGNHDYMDFAAILREHGVEAYNLDDGPVTVAGVRFAGFRAVPWIAGEWNGEAHDFRDMVDAALAADPEVLVTHAPPASILDDDNGCGHGHGIREITTALTYRPHNIKAHLFGHIHANGMRKITEMGVLFANSAGGVQMLNL
jgi:Icc-related predicted phosphoesterase